MARRGTGSGDDPDRRPAKWPESSPASDPASNPASNPAIRLTDAERDEAMARLSEHYAVGRLDKQEFDERSDAIWKARTGADLAPLFADLEPAPPAPPAPRVVRPWHQQLPVVPLVILALIALTIFTHVPFVALAFFGVFVFGRGRRRW